MTNSREAILSLIEKYGTYFILNEEFVREYNSIINEKSGTIDQLSNGEQQNITQVETSEDNTFVNNEQETPPAETHQDEQTNSREKPGLSFNDIRNLCNYLNQPNKIRIGTNLGFGTKISEVFFEPNYFGLKVLYRLNVQPSNKLKKLSIILLCYDNKNNCIIMRTKQFNPIVSQVAFFLIPKADNCDLSQIDHIILNIAGEP